MKKESSISKVKSAIEKLPCIIANELIIDNRGDVVLSLKGIIVFTNQVAYDKLHEASGKLLEVWKKLPEAPKNLPKASGIFCALTFFPL